MNVPVLSVDDYIAIQNHIQAIITLLEEKGVIKNLTDDEKASLNIIGNKRKPAAQKALEIAKANEGILSRDFSLEDHEGYLDLAFGLESQVAFRLLQLLEIVNESRFFFGDKGWDGSRQIKQWLETANRTEPGLDALLKELNEHFARASEGEEDTTPEPPAGEGTE